ncbi:MAG: hypothetical protein ACKN81_20290 [Pirellulaceae bacterium]
MERGPDGFPRLTLGSWHAHNDDRWRHVTQHLKDGGVLHAPHGGKLATEGRFLDASGGCLSNIELAVGLRP